MSSASEFIPGNSLNNNDTSSILFTYKMPVVTIFTGEAQGSEKTNLALFIEGLVEQLQRGPCLSIEAQVGPSNLFSVLP